MKKEMKKSLSLVLILVMALLMFSCGNDTSDLPVMEEVTVENAESATSGNFTAQYDGEQWYFDDTFGFAVYDKEVYESGNPDGKCANVNVSVSQAYDGPFTEKDMEDVVKQTTELGISGYEIGLKELRLFQEEPIIYFESSLVMSDDMLDLMIEQGAITEQDIEDLGGREAVLDGASTTQVSVCAIIDGYITIFTGTYYDDETKQEVLNVILGMIQTGNVTA